MATTDRFIKLLAAKTDDELEKEIAKMSDKQKNLMIKGFIKTIRSESVTLDDLDQRFQKYGTTQYM